MHFFELRMNGATFLVGPAGTPYAGVKMGLTFGYGRPVNPHAVVEPIRLARSRPGSPLTDICFSDAFVPVVSQPVADLIRTIAGADVQIFRAEVDGIDQARYLVNLTHVSDDLDESRSSFERVPPGDPLSVFGRYKSVIRVVLDATKVGSHHLFRFASQRQATVVASQELTGALTAIRATGIEPFPAS